MMPENEHEYIARQFDRVVKRLRQDYKDACEIQCSLKEKSEMWWWAQGRRDASEVALRTIGCDP